MKLNRKTSGYIVNELVAALGGSRTQDILKVSAARFKAFCEGRGCLSLDQLEQMTRLTNRAWERWVVDAGASRVKTADGRAFVAGAYAMWDEILGPQETAPGRVSQRRREASALRQAV